MKTEETTAEMKKLIHEMAAALETCDSFNRSKMNWSQTSPFQEKIEELSFRAGWRKEPPNNQNVADRTTSATPARLITNPIIRRGG